MTRDRRRPFVGLWYRRHPELSHFSSRAELARLRSEFRARGGENRVFRPLFIAALAASAVLSVILYFVLRGAGLGLWSAQLINILVWIVAGTALTVVLWQRPYIRFLREHLQSRGVPICLRCGYDLSGQSEPRCPECGEPFDSALLKTDPPGAR